MKENNIHVSTSTKPGKNSQFCWQHQNCQNIATTASQETKKSVKKNKPIPLPPGPKKLNNPKGISMHDKLKKNKGWDDMKILDFLEDQRFPKKIIFHLTTKKLSYS